tara:strand:+ start:1742 stop:2071 length:330 start_codon:yes stop_codon:yes gene_type:complete
MDDNIEIITSHNLIQSNNNNHDNYNKTKGGKKKNIDYLDPKSKYFNPNITIEDRYPLDCSIINNKKQYLCKYNSEDKNKFKKQYPIDCNTEKYKLDRRCRTFAKKKNIV